MKRQNLFCTPVWTTMLDDYENLNKELLAVAGKYRMGENYFGIPETQKLADQVVPIVRKVADECGYTQPFTISGRQNPMAVGQNNTPHHHPDCMFAVVYYVKVPEKSGDILLHDPRGSILWQDPEARTDVNWQSYRPYHKITPVPGMLLIFPGYVVHSVEHNLSDDVRISIAISIFIIYRKHIIF